MNLREHARSPVRQARRRTARVRCSTPENLESLGRSFERRQECHSEPETRNLGPGAVDHGRYRNCQPLWISENRSRTGVPKGRPFGGGLGGDPGNPRKALLGRVGEKRAWTFILRSFGGNRHRGLRAPLDLETLG